MVGFIPVLGQIADARDTLAAIKSIWDGKEGAWGDLGLASIAWAPAIGDLAKGALKIDGKAAKAAGGGRRAIANAPDGTPILGGRLRLTRDTAKTSGIRHIEGGRLPNGTIGVQITGELKPSIKRSEAPNYNKGGDSISSMGPEVNARANGGLSTHGYEKAHLWGPGFGDEARDGIMLAPYQVNQIFQNDTMEEALRVMQHQVREQYGDSAKVVVTASAVSHPTMSTRPLNEPVLAEATYKFSVETAGGTKELATVHINVDKPPLTNPDVQIQISATAADGASDDAAVLLDALPKKTPRAE